MRCKTFFDQLRPFTVEKQDKKPGVLKPLPFVYFSYFLQVCELNRQLSNYVSVPVNNNMKSRLRAGKYN